MIVVLFLCVTSAFSVNSDQICELVTLQLVYHSLQLVAFTVLAILIMRLKLFLTPHMSIMASLICSKQVRPKTPCTLCLLTISVAILHHLNYMKKLNSVTCLPFIFLLVVWLDRGEA